MPEVWYLSIYAQAGVPEVWPLSIYALAFVPEVWPLSIYALASAPEVWQLSLYALLTSSFYQPPVFDMPWSFTRAVAAPNPGRDPAHPPARDLRVAVFRVSFELWS